MEAPPTLSFRLLGSACTAPPCAGAPNPHLLRPLQQRYPPDHLPRIEFLPACASRRPRSDPAPSGSAQSNLLRSEPREGGHREWVTAQQLRTHAGCHPPPRGQPLPPAPVCQPPTPGLACSRCSANSLTGSGTAGPGAHWPEPQSVLPPESLSSGPLQDIVSTPSLEACQRAREPLAGGHRRNSCDTRVGTNLGFFKLSSLVPDDSKESYAQSSQDRKDRNCRGGRQGPGERGAGVGGLVFMGTDFQFPECWDGW